MSIERARLSKQPTVDIEAAETAQSTEPQPAKKGGPSVAARVPQGTASLIRMYDQKRGSELSAVAKADGSRAEAARGAIADLAQAVGEDASAFARRYAEPSQAGKSPAQIQAQARFDFVRDVLSRRPDAADAIIGVRLRGVDSATRALAQAAVEQSGARGVARYAACEKSLAAVAGLDADARGDVLGMVRAGERFARAVELEKKTLGKIDRERAAPPSTTELTKQALANAEARAASVRKLGAQVQRTLHAIGKLSRSAELVTGVGAAAGTVGSATFAAGESIVTGSMKPLRRAAHEAERAGGFIAGELSGKIREADRTAVKLLQTGSRFETLVARNKEAIQRGDHAAALETSKQLDGVAAEMKQQAESLAAQAKSIGKLNADFDGATEHAALNVLLTGAFYAIGSLPGVDHAVHGATKAAAARVAPIAGQRAGAVAGEVVHAGLHAAADGAIARGYGAIRH